MGYSWYDNCDSTCDNPHPHHYVHPHQHELMSGDQFEDLIPKDIFFLQSTNNDHEEELMDSHANENSNNDDIDPLMIKEDGLIVKSIMCELMNDLMQENMNSIHHHDDEDEVQEQIMNPNFDSYIHNYIIDDEENQYDDNGLIISKDCGIMNPNHIISSTNSIANPSSAMPIITTIGSAPPNGYHYMNMFIPSVNHIKLNRIDITPASSETRLLQMLGHIDNLNTHDAINPNSHDNINTHDVINPNSHHDHAPHHHNTMLSSNDSLLNLGPNLSSLTDDLRPHVLTSSLVKDNAIDPGPNKHFGSSSSSSDDYNPIFTMQRSQSSHALGQFGRTDKYLDDANLAPASRASGFVNLSALPNISESSPVLSMRRVVSTGDLQAYQGPKLMSYHGEGLNPSTILEGPSHSEEFLGMKIGHYSSEERKVRLHRYRQKRSERNFNKKIKYACRKTLADSRPRIRGRFARTIEDCEEPNFIKEINRSCSYDDLIYESDEDRQQVTPINENQSCKPISNFGAYTFWNSIGRTNAIHYRV